MNSRPVIWGCLLLALCAVTTGWGLSAAHAEDDPVPKAKLAPLPWLPAEVDFARHQRLMADIARVARPGTTTDDGKEVIIKLPAAGFRKEDFKVQVTDGVLQVSGRKASRQTRKGIWFFFARFDAGTFSHTQTLPAGLDEQNVTVAYRDSTLEVRIPYVKAEK